MVFPALGHHVIEVGEVSVHGVDVPVVGNVVAEIDLGGGKTGSDPDGVDAQFMEVTHFGADAVEVADAVVIAVGKTAGIDFVKHGVLPPLMAFGIDRLGLSSGGKGTRKGQQQEQDQRWPPGHEMTLLNISPERNIKRLRKVRKWKCNWESVGSRAMAADAKANEVNRELSRVAEGGFLYGEILPEYRAMPTMASIPSASRESISCWVVMPPATSRRREVARRSALTVSIGIPPINPSVSMWV